ncbi:MAG: SEC-C domain-containing protein [Nannocystis sp.]|nr:SEC-C domain-containing protein [Nannocystis sp.]
MDKIGRNERCPCGSGKKFKKCCLLRRDAAAYSRSDREAALMRLTRSFDEDRALSAELTEEFYAEVPQGSMSAGLFDMSSAAFQGWAYFDAALDEDDETLASYALGRPGFSPSQRLYLEIMLASSMRLYEVVEVAPGASMTLRDLITDERVVVQERSATRQITRWQVLATRVVSQGDDALPKVCDGGMLPIPPAHRDALVEFIRGELAAMRDQEPEVDEVVRQRALFKSLVPTFHRVWITPTLPRSMVNYDGDPLVFCESFFDLHDREAAVARLDAAEAIESNDGGWVWLGAGGQRAEPVVFGFVERRGDRIVVVTNSEARAARGRALVGEILGPTATYRLTSTRDAMNALKEHSTRPSREERGLDPSVREGLSDAVEAHLHRHYEGWIDENLPALDGATPRAATTDPRLRPRLFDLIKDLEVYYARALRDGEPAFDPSWLWDELDLRRELADAGARLPPQLGHERIAARVPGLEAVAQQVAARLGGGRRAAIGRTIDHDELRRDLGVRRFLQELPEGLPEEASGDLEGAADVSVLGAHLEVRANFELHLRKVFWVDDPLAWTLGATRLDVAGEALRLPFGAFALVFTDRYALGLAERALSRAPTCPIRGMLLSVVTVYVMERAAPDGGRGIRLAITCDPGGDVWPHLLVRDLWITPGADLEAALTSRFPGLDDDLAPLFACAPIRSLVQLILNAILYATSADARAEPREPEAPVERRPVERVVRTSESIHFLPGTIDITTLRAIQRARRGASDLQIIHQAMVRGHWRGAGADWKDQRVRWIKPYWRGPSAATVIERHYSLRP